MGERRRGGGARWKRRGLLTLVALAGVVVVYNLLTAAAVRVTDARVPRDAETGLLIGAKPYRIGPEDATTAVVLVHGFLGVGGNFNDLPQRLAAEGLRVSVILLPGHGTSPRDFADVKTETLLEAVRGEVSALRKEHERVILVGHSMGGALSVLVTSEGAVDGLVLAAPYFAVTHRWYYGLRPETWTRVLAPLARWAYKGKLFLQVNDRSAEDAIVSYTWVPSSASRELVRIGERANRVEVLSGVTCPVLWLHAPGDVAASFEAAERAYTAFSSDTKRAVVLPRSNHHIFYDYDKDLVLRETVAFVAALDRAD